ARGGGGAARESHDRPSSAGERLQVRPTSRHHVDLMPLRDHCSEVREAGAVGGWPAPRHDPAPSRLSRPIPPEVREAGAVGGWPAPRHAPSGSALSITVVAGSASPLHSVGGLPQVRSGSALSITVVAGSASPPHSVGGLPQVRSGFALIVIA